MKVLHLSTEDIEGGAARAAYRLNQGLNDLGNRLDNVEISSKLLVRNKQSRSPFVIKEESSITKLGPMLDKLPLKRYPERKKVLFSTQWMIDVLEKQVSTFAPDIVHLHWINNGFLRIESLKKFKIPMVWTFHDMWPFTGGCHYSQTCERYQTSCGDCPILNSHTQKDLSFHILKRKARAWRELNLTLVSPSNWLANCASSSKIFKDKHVEVIPNGVDMTTFRPGLKVAAREILNLPQDKKIILFVAGSTTGDPRKGFRYLVEALKIVQSQSSSPIELAILGEELPANPLSLGLKTHYLGKFNDEVSLALVYNSADLFVAPSVQDNLPNTVVEALACGTPCVAFKIGGMSDMIDHQVNGYLAEPFDVASLAKGIDWIIEDSHIQQKLSSNAFQKAKQNFDVICQSNQFYKLYDQIINLT